MIAWRWRGLCTNRNYLRPIGVLLGLRAALHHHTKDYTKLPRSIPHITPHTTHSTRLICCTRIKVATSVPQRLPKLKTTWVKTARLCSIKHSLRSKASNLSQLSTTTTLIEKLISKLLVPGSYNWICLKSLNTACITT